MEEEWFSFFSITQRCNEYGLTDIVSSFPFDDEKFKKDFIDSKKVYILMNDGKNFITSHINMIYDRFQQEQKETNIVLLDYEQRDTMSVLTRKNRHG